MDTAHPNRIPIGALRLLLGCYSGLISRAAENLGQRDKSFVFFWFGRVYAFVCSVCIGVHLVICHGAVLRVYIYICACSMRVFVSRDSRALVEHVVHLYDAGVNVC